MQGCVNTGREVRKNEGTRGEEDEEAAKPTEKKLNSVRNHFAKQVNSAFIACIMCAFFIVCMCVWTVCKCVCMYNA